MSLYFHSKLKWFVTFILVQFFFTFVLNTTLQGQVCVFESAAYLYKTDSDEPEKVYRPIVKGSDIQFYSSGNIDANETKTKAKKVLLILDQHKGNFLVTNANESRCSEGSELFARPENEDIIMLTKKGELIKGYGVLWPESESFRVWKNEHQTGGYYNNVSSTADIVLSVYYSGDTYPSTRIYVSAKELSSYIDKIYALLVPAAELPSSLIAELPNTNSESDSQATTGQKSQEEPEKVDSKPMYQEESSPPIELKTQIEEVKSIEPVSENPPADFENTEDLLLSEPEIISTPVVRTKGKPVLNDIEREEIMVKAKEKVETLGSCFEIIASTVASNALKDDNNKLALSLFINDSAEVTVSTINSTAIKQYPIVTYLKRMRNFNYSNVEISFHNVSKVSNLRRNPDGTYTGIITFSQVFKGFIEGQTVYADRTDKNIEIIIKAREVFAGALEASIEWDVFLGNIGVDQTSSLENKR